MSVAGPNSVGAPNATAHGTPFAQGPHGARTPMVLSAGYVSMPGQCARCASTDSQAVPIVDLGLTFRQYGRVYLCAGCLHELATLAGYVLPDEVNEVRDELAIANDTICDLTDRLSALTDLENLVRVTVGKLPQVEPDPELGEFATTSGEPVSL